MVFLWLKMGMEDWGCGWVIEHLPGMHSTLGSIVAIAKKRWINWRPNYFFPGIKWLKDINIFNICKRCVAFCDKWHSDSGSCNIAFPVLLQRRMVDCRNENWKSRSIQERNSCSKMAKFHAIGDFQAFEYPCRLCMGIIANLDDHLLLLHLRPWHRFPCLSYRKSKDLI